MPLSLPAFTPDDHRFMEQCLELAREAGARDEVPVGAVVVVENRVVGRGFNQPIAAQDPTAHAEMLALREAARQLGNYRLPGATLYCTLEPCVMCAGALVTARLGRLIFAARDLRFGAVRSKFQLADSPLLNHRMRIEEGLRAAEAGELLAAFFLASRERDPPPLNPPVDE